MIATIEEATAHAAQFLTKSNFVAVLPDGHIYLCKSQDELLKFTDAFIVKGEQIVKTKTKKDFQITE